MKNTRFGTCYSKEHNIIGVSEHSKDRVPIFLLLKYPDKTESISVFKTCLDCRKYAKQRRENLQKRKKIVKKSRKKRI